MKGEFSQQQQLLHMGHHQNNSIGVCRWKTMKLMTKEQELEGNRGSEIHCPSSCVKG